MEPIREYCKIVINLNTFPQKTNISKNNKIQMTIKSLQGSKTSFKV